MSKGKWKKPLNIVLSAGLVASLGIPAGSTNSSCSNNCLGFTDF